VNLAAAEDLYPRMVVGWSITDRTTSRLVINAFEMVAS
jgi:hypothetical protein